MAKKLIAAIADSGLFLREWFVNPQHTGAVAPSSPKLAAAMARWLPANPESYVLELGPGTGAVTEALMDRGLREDRLVAIERNPKLASLLRKRFPRALIISGDAWQMVELLRERHHSIEKVGAVISSLPLLNFPPDQCAKLADQINALLEDQGKWVQYSYHIGKRPPGSARFRCLTSKVVWLNIPPARVHVFQK